LPSGQVKGGSASYLLRGQKYARVGSGPISWAWQNDNQTNAIQISGAAFLPCSAQPSSIVL